MRAVFFRWQTHSVILLSGILALTLAFPICACSAALAGNLSEQATRIGNRPDVARVALRAEAQRIAGKRSRAYLGALNQEAARIRSSLPAHPTEAALLAALNTHFFSPAGYSGLTDLTAPENGSFAAVLDNRRGTCVGLAIVYLALAQRLDLHAQAVATPVHLFIRVRIGGTVHNVELLEAGREIVDDTYRRRYKIDEASIAAGAFMKELTNDELIAHLLSNQAVALSKQGKLKEALRRYDRALKMHPKLVAAWYDRGIDLMNGGRLKDALASFSRAIELYPSDAQAHNNRGLTRLKLGDAEGARVDFQRTLEIDPSLTEAEENLKRLLSGRSNPR